MVSLIEVSSVCLNWCVNMKIAGVSVREEHQDQNLLLKPSSRRPQTEKEWPGESPGIGLHCLILVQLLCRNSECELHVLATEIIFKLALNPEYFYPQLCLAWGEFLKCVSQLLPHHEWNSGWGVAASLSFQESHVTPSLLCPCFPPATPGRGNEQRGTRVLISRVSWPAELQTDCWLTQPSGRQHVWHHATCNIWQRWSLNGIFFACRPLHHFKSLKWTKNYYFRTWNQNSLDVIMHLIRMQWYHYFWNTPALPLVFIFGFSSNARMPL